MKFDIKNYYNDKLFYVSFIVILQDHQYVEKDDPC